MHEWLLVGCLLVLLAALAAAALAALPLRRRWLAREGGLFECSVRLNRSTPGAGWALGMARYNAEMLEWFRFLSYSSKPTPGNGSSNWRNRAPGTEPVSLGRSR